MDVNVISNVTENGNNCDDYKNSFRLVEISKTLHAVNTSTVPPVQVGDSNQFDNIMQGTKLCNVDVIDKNHNYEENICTFKTSSTDNNSEIKKSLTDFNIYNVDNLNMSHNPKAPIFKSDTSDHSEYIICTKKKKSTQERRFQGINKLPPDETDDIFKKALLYKPSDEEKNIQIGSILTPPCLSKCFDEKVYNDIEKLDTELNQKSGNINTTIIHEDNDVPSKSKNQPIQYNSGLLVSRKFSEVASEDNFVKDGNIMRTEVVNPSSKSHQYKNNNIDENIISTYNNTTEVLSKKDNHCLEGPDPQILSTFKNYIFESDLHKLNGTFPDIKGSKEYCYSLVEPKVKHVHNYSIAPVIICNTNFIVNKSEDGVSSSHIDKKVLTTNHSYCDSSETKKDNLLKNGLEHLGNNNSSLSGNKSSEILASSNNITNHFKKNKTDFSETKKKNVNPNISYAENSYHIESLQPCSDYEKYNFYKPGKYQYEKQAICNSSSNYDNCYKINYADGKISKYSQMKNICEYNKMPSKFIVNSLVHDYNGNNSNISMFEDNCRKNSTVVDTNIELPKHKQCYSSVIAGIPLQTAHKFPPYVISNNNIKRCNNKYLPSVPGKIKTLTQLQMNPLDFSKVCLVESTPKENLDEYNASRKNFNEPVTSQNFEEISKKFNYIKDLQLKNPTSTDSFSYKENLRRDLDPQIDNLCSNIYIETPDFSGKCFSTDKEKKEKIKISNSISYFNTDNMSTISNDLAIIEQNNCPYKNYADVYNTNSTISPNIQTTANVNTNTSNRLHNDPKYTANSLEAKIKLDDAFFDKKCRISNNQYYSSVPFHPEEHLTSVHETCSSNINIPTVRNNCVYLEKEGISQKNIQGLKNSRDYNGNIDYNLKRTTSVIKIGEHANLDYNSNFIRLKTNCAHESVLNNNEQNVQLPEKQFPQCVTKKSPYLNFKNSFSNYSHFIPVGQTKNEKILGSTCHDTSFQTTDRSSLLTKCIKQQAKNPVSNLPLSIRQNYNPAVENDQHQLLCTVDKNTESVAYKNSTDEVIDYAAHFHDERIKNAKSTEYNKLISLSGYKSYTSLPSRSSSETAKILQKPNYREMINHVYAMRNSTSEDDLNLQIIKRTLNCDISFRKSDNDLRQSIFDSPEPKKNSSAYVTEKSFPYRHDEKITNSRNQYNIDTSSNEYKDSHVVYHEKSHNVPFANHDISVTVSKITKPKEIKPFIVEMKNNINFNSEYPKAVITKGINQERYRSFPVEIHHMPSKLHNTLNESSNKHNFTHPLDLSVKTIKTIADSTGCNDGYIHNRKGNESTRSAPKFIFQPDFSQTGINNHEKGRILSSVTSSVKQNINRLSTYSMKKDVLGIQGQIKTESKLQSISECVASKISCDKIEHNIFNNNKLESNLLFPLSDRDLRFDGKSEYEINNQLIPWQQIKHSQSVSAISQKNDLLPTCKNEKLVNMSNITNNFYVNNGETSEKFEPKFELDYTLREKSADNINSAFRIKAVHLEQKYGNNDHILVYSESQSELRAKSHTKLSDNFRPQKKHIRPQKKYPPPKESIYDKEKNIFLSGDPLSSQLITLPINFAEAGAVDQTVKSKLKNSIELKDNKKLKLDELPEKHDDSSKLDTASLLAARIRTKGELKGFNQPPLEENVQERDNYCDSDVINTKLLNVANGDFSDLGQNASFNLLDWRIACNDFAEQLQCGVSKKRKKSQRIVQTYGSDKQLETGKSLADLRTINNCFESELKSLCTQYNKRKFVLASESSEEDKPLLLFRQQNNIQANSNFSKNIENNQTYKTTVCEETLSQISKVLDANSVNKSTHSPIVEKFSEKVARNIREKQRIEQEKRIAARLGEISSSESEDNKLNYRMKKISKVVKSKISIRKLSGTVSSGADSISISKNLINLEKNCIQNTSNISVLHKDESNIELNKILNEKQVMTKAEMKFMAPSKKNHKMFEQNIDSNNFLIENKCEINLNKSNCEINLTQDHNIKINNLKAKKSGTPNYDGHNNTIQLEETMTRSKRKKALENQIASNKILRNDKIINYTHVDKNEKRNIKKRGIKPPITKSETKKKRKKYKNGMYSSASSGELEIKSVSNRLRPRRLSLENKINSKGMKKLVKNKTKEKDYDKKKLKLSATHNKRTFFKIKKDMGSTEKCKTPKFPPGWEDQVYEYKKSLKVPLRLITIKGSHNNRISTSLPDLNLHSSDDATENVGSKQNLFCNKKDTKIEEPRIINNIEGENKVSYIFSDKDNGTKHILQQQNSRSRSIIDVLHSRMFMPKKIPKRMLKPFNRHGPKLLPQSTNQLELLPTLTVHNDYETLDQQHNVFKTEVLKSRTRTETRNLKYQELIRKVFGGKHRPASAPPGIRNVKNKEAISFEDKYEQYLQKLNVELRRNNEMQPDKRKNDYKNETMGGDDFKSFTQNKNNGNNKITSDSLNDKTQRLFSNRDSVVSNLFKLKKNNKYRSGRRRGSSGFDYIRKKKKPSCTITYLNNQEIIKRKKASSEEFHYNRDENDVSKEIQKWVLNKSVGQSALHKAARLGYLDVIVYCLERMGMNPDPKDNAGYTPLHEACSKGRIDIARVLLQYGANHSETAHSGIRPLHEASENGYIEIVRLLLSYGADPLLTTYSGQTPLMLSESNEMEQFIKNHLYDVQNTGPHKQPWKFQGPWKIFDPYKYGYDVLSGAPDIGENYDAIGCNRNEKCLARKNKSSLNIINTEKYILNSSYNMDKEDFNVSIGLDVGELFQLEEADIPLPPLYLLKDEGSAKWVLLSDLCTLLKVKSKDTLLKQICLSTPPSTINKELLRELKMSDFLEKATCLQLLCAGEKLNIRASKVILVKYNERVQTLLGVKTVVMKF